MKYSFNIGLSTKDIDNLVRELDIYAKDILTNKTDLLVKKLAERGIVVAKNHLYSEFAPCVDFIYTPTGIGKGTVESKTKLIHRVWYRKQGRGDNASYVKAGEYDISPILMAEFGAGRYAPSEWRGSLGKNGLKDVWYWFDSQGNKHSSEDDDTIKPTRPMYNMIHEMIKICDEVAKEVFGT